MSRVFSIRTVLRQTPNRLIREFLAQLGHSHLSIPWEELGERDVEPMVEAFNTLTAMELDLIEGTLHTIFDLACATGINTIRETVTCLGQEDLPADLLQEASFYELAMWAWLNRRQAIEQALILHQVDQMTWWRRRNDLPQREPNVSQDTLLQLKQELSTLLRHEDGRGRNCTVETFARRGTTYYFAFPDDFVLNATAHDDDGRLAPRTFRRTFTVVFAFDPMEGALELYAKVSARLKPQLERLFAQIILGIELGDWNPQPAYEPNALRAREFRLETEPEDNVIVDVRQLRLSLVNSHRQIILKGDPAWRGDVFRMMEEVLDRERVPPSAFNITLITFCFEFHSVGDRRAGSVTFDVAFPNSCSLRNQRPERVAVIMKYLTRWGIHVERTAGSDLAAAGL